jgi:thioredoxin 1
MPASPVTIACLCAAWCRTCDTYRAVFEAAVDELRTSGRAVDAHWIDIEDQAELVGELEVQTFPSILLAEGGKVCFYGPLEPQPETLRRLLRSLSGVATKEVSTTPVGPAAAALAQRLDRR